MSDIQILTISAAILVPHSLLLLSNSRIGDAKETLRADMRADRAETNARFDRLESKIDKIGDTLSQMLVDHEQRISRLEDRR
ncbi:MAG: hypothetical protein M3Z85_13695 [Acidobacteriota bacterium]|nr:hypothetical protein [Acidobacteriota bacterium]